MGYLDKLRKRQKRVAKADDLKGGVVTNVNIVKFTKELEPIKNYKRYMLIKFKQFEGDDVVGEYTHTFFALDMASEYLPSNVDELIMTGYYLIAAIKGEENVEEYYNPFKDLIDSEDEKDYEHSVIMALIEERKFTKKLEENIVEQVSAVLEEFVESKEAETTTFNIKLTYNKKGKLQFGGDDCIERYTEEGEASLIISEYESGLINQFNN